MTEHTARVTKPCAVPGCCALMNSNYRSYAHGVCRTHRHAPGLCQCAACGNAAPRPTLAQRRDDIRVAMMASGSAREITALVPVSLRKEPWL